MESLDEAFSFASQLSSSCTCMNDAMISRSTSLGEPSARALPRAVMIIGPKRPVLMSRTSSTCEWYIHITELPSIGPGPARSGTGQM